MIRNPKAQCMTFFLLLLLLTLTYNSIVHSNGENQKIQLATQQHYMLTTPGNIYQGDQLNMSLSITNVHFEAILNVTISVTYPNEVEFLNSSFGDLSVDNETREFEYQIGSIDTDEILFMYFEYNVTDDRTGTITFEGVETSFQLLDNKDPPSETSNSVDVLLKGPTIDTTTNTLPLKQIGTIDADDAIIIVAYLIPMVFFAISIIIMRRLRR